MEIAGVELLRLKSARALMSEKVAENLSSVMQKIDRAARKSGRMASEVKLVAVTKTVEIKKISEAIKAGVSAFGENYVQEAQEKIEKFDRKPVRWHFLGHLQKNKAKFAVELFDIIETVDSFDLAKELSKRAKKDVAVLIQINIGKEKNKAGIDIKEVVKLVRKISELPNIRVKGLMAVPPYQENPEASRPYFVTLRRTAERVNREHIPNVSMRELSMGMSHDFEVAIEEGATIVRIGRAIFGERPAKKTVKN